MLGRVALPHDMADELPEAVLIELGKLTWSAIRLESLTDWLCHFIRHTNYRRDHRTIGPRIKDALIELSLWPDGSSEVDQIRDWLAKSQLALDKRNALLHSVPLILFNQGQRVGHALGERPRANSGYQGGYHVRQMDESQLREVRAQLDAAVEDWAKILEFAEQHRPQ